ncbi:tyrosine-type recombinase/integrase [Paracraurococcus lichenis]|uniref:Tyrosine-type recombinase/integrase n=1 Tax=Paracraurococcus lichenis TaxID=3064888 RepID=A0ABT9EAH1_9PROT|nr:tyrosine-type recombinase/integrase [Paracraurococcus sp. LOR1-02]MDO9713179.1 tyrosine-type recombinase/integrase [Paracraurococcus sp. LOR1-02]
MGKHTGLRVVTRSGTDKWYLRGNVAGQNVYESTGTADRAAAEAIRIHREKQILDASIFGEKAVVTFAHALDSYLEVKERSAHTKALLKPLLEHFGTTKLARIDQVAVDEACKKLLPPGSSPAWKLRAVIAPMNAVLEHAARRGWCSRPALEKPTVPPPKTPFLLPEQATALVRAAAPHLRPVLVFILAVGCRPSEALGLPWSSVDLDGAHAIIDLGKTGGRELPVALRPVVVQALKSLPHRVGPVFRTRLQDKRAMDGTTIELGEGYRVKREGVGRINTAWQSACRRAGLPGEWREYRSKRGKMTRVFKPTHVPYCLRHTFATWHYCVHRDMQMLRDEVGWTTIRMVERYAKRMSPKHREAVIDWWEGRVDLGLGNSG